MTQEEKIKKVIDEITTYLPNGGNLNFALFTQVLTNNRIELNKKVIIEVKKILLENKIEIDTDVDDEDEDISNIKPFDYSKINIDQKLYTLQNIVDRLQEDEIELTPDYQRNLVWNTAKKSRLIESIFLNIPLPSFYFDATNPSKWIVIDGLQRLSSIKEFFIDKTLVLQGLEYLSLNGKKADEVPQSYIRRSMERNITGIMMLPSTPSDIKFNIFKRINTGGVSLNSQEIRNALATNRVRKVLLKFSKSPEFLKATSYSISDSRMLDKEFVLRYLSFRINDIEQYKKSNSFDDFLTKSCERLDKIDESIIDEMYDDFVMSMKTNYEIFGKKAFRKISISDGNRINPINKGLFDCFSVIISKMSKEECKKLILNKNIIIEKLSNLLDKANTSSKLLTYISSASVNSVENRFLIVRNLLKEVLNND